MLTHAGKSATAKAGRVSAIIDTTVIGNISQSFFVNCGREGSFERPERRLLAVEGDVSLFIESLIVVVSVVHNGYLASSWAQRRLDQPRQAWVGSDAPRTPETRCPRQ
ncbi:hypothetical protein ACV4V9_24050 [Pseudomonas aeruginosa]